MTGHAKSWEKVVARDNLMNKVGHRLIKEGHLISTKRKESWFCEAKVQWTARFGWIWRVTTIDGMVVEIVKSRPAE